MLDNEEVKQLLKKTSDFEQTTEMLSENNREIVIELFKKPFESVAKAISKILGKESSVGEITADIANAGLLKETLGESYYLADAVYKSGLLYALSLSKEDRKIIFLVAPLAKLTA